MNCQANFHVEHLIVCYALLIMSDHTLCKKINNICSSGCKRWANPFDIQTYFEEIHNQNISRPCAPGSSFDQSACGCTQHVTDDTVIAQPTSKPSSRRNFDNHICWFWLQSCLLLITYIGLYFNNVSFQCPLMWYSIWKTKFTYFLLFWRRFDYICLFIVERFGVIGFSALITRTCLQSTNFILENMIFSAFLLAIWTKASLIIPSQIVGVFGDNKITIFLTASN